MATSTPPKKARATKPDVSRYRIDDPTAAFPIGSLSEPVSLEGDAVKPLPEAASSTSPPPKPPTRAPVASPATGGVNVRWLVMSLMAGAVLAVVVVALFGLVVMLVGS
jgi:hypothetical protein